MNFSFSISPYNEYSGLISFRIDWFDLISVQETLKSLLQHHSLKASILRHYFFIVQLSRVYMTTRKKHSFDYTEICRQSNACLLIYCHCFSSKEQVSFNFLAAVNVHNDLGALESKVCHCFLIYLP